MKSPFTRTNLNSGDIIKLSTIANKLVPQRGNTANKRRLKNQYERIVTESKLRDVIEEINSITKRKIPNAAKKTILNGSNLPQQRAMLEKKLRNMP
jgi:ribosomal protein S21